MAHNASARKGRKHSKATVIEVAKKLATRALVRRVTKKVEKLPQLEL